MEVADKIILGNNHSIEWGTSTWDEDDFSVRNRFDTEEGKFNKFGSSEISWNDFNEMILESIRRNHFSNQQLTVIMNEIELLTARK